MVVFPNHIPVPLLIPLLIVVPLAFALLHGAQRYQWSGILTFLVMCLVVSNLLENTSILTGFPLGHYYYMGSTNMAITMRSASSGRPGASLRQRPQSASTPCSSRQRYPP